jgi:tRNA pseudouridine65 synthase
VALQLLRDQIGRFVYPVHRLDRPTSGVLVFALDPESAARLAEQFAGATVRKQYLAVVRGHVPEAGRIEHALRGMETDAACDAVTEYRRIGITEWPVPVGPHGAARYSLVDVAPLTGRMHQIRRHFKHIAHPLIGDTRYGDGAHNRLFRREFGTYRLLLHALRVTLAHPATGDPLALGAPVPDDMAGVLAALGWPDGVWR